MKLDGRDRLFVAGGSGGDGRVVNTRTGKILGAGPFTDSQNTFVNDVVLTRRAAFFTDSSQAVLYRVPLGQRLAASPTSRRSGSTGAWQQTPGFNANGIAQTPDGRALLVDPVLDRQPVPRQPGHRLARRRSTWARPC